MTGRTITLGQRASFWVAAAVVAHTIWTSAAPAMTYPLYAAQWRLTTTQTAMIFAIYPIVVVGILICFGDVSDYIGRRTTMLLGLAASFIGVLLFAIAPNLLWVYIGRMFMGIGVGLSAGPSTAAVIEFSAPGQAKKASAITTVAQATGLALATLIGGALIEYAPFPTRLNFLLLLLIITLIFIAAWFLPRHNSQTQRGRWRPRTPTISPGLGMVVLAATAAVVSAYAIGTVGLSLGAQIARDLIGSSNVLLNGATMSVFAVVLGAVGLLCKGLSSRMAIIVGGVCAVLGMLFLVISVGQHSLLIFLVFLMAAGCGYSLLFMGGLGLINTYAPTHNRGGTLSTLYLVAYLVQGGLALLLGAIATHWGLARAIDLGALAIIALSLATAAIALFIMVPKPQHLVHRCGEHKL
ncbi:MFS transporter [Acerihabitans sp. TG2]|uniref:MFS transporter n=1 Tax=Acerihabitans sp. TG2 TaxID=3096008 RepID=UPI002B22A8BB|nr:MFS transporter [Acerihabitans sp. TG2]MEA9389322.1 MFS transporter [Acerihabitans sp. TG2]